MKISYQWLKELVPLRLKAEALAERLTMIGLEVVSIQTDASGEIVLEIEVTSNRPDCLGLIGLAREAGAILAMGQARSKGIILPRVKFKEGLAKTADEVKVTVQDKKLCHRYVARLIKGVKVEASPLWLQNRLKALGIRPINNVVDVTNYVLLEYGQPLHAFDFDKLKGGKIVVRRARDNEEITTLDGLKHKLDKSILIIADKEIPQALAGIMGGKDSEVTAATRNILLESAYFEPVVIRRAAKKLGLSTESSYRFERGVDKEAVLSASRRAAGLIQDLAGGEILTGEIDHYPYPFKPIKIYLRLRRIKDLLGVEVEKPGIKNIFKNLGLKVEKSETELWKIQVPSFRRDLSLEIDLIEEIARHFGYSRIPAILPEITIKPPERENNYGIYQRAREIMAAIGFQEVINFSFQSFKEQEKTSPGQGVESGQAISIRNPLSEEQAVLRLSLASGLLATASRNINRGESNIKIFEAGKIFYPKDGREPQEKYNLGGLIIGEVSPRHWSEAIKETDYYYTKGVIEFLLHRLGLEGFDFKKTGVAGLVPDSATIIVKGDKQIGWLGEVKDKVFVFELFLEDIIPCLRKTIIFREPPRFPPTFRDLSLIVPVDLENKKIISAISKSAEGYLESIEVLDFYKGNQIPVGFFGLTYRLTLRSPQRTLTDEEVDNLQSGIISQLMAAFSIRLRTAH